jgi:hypothetical protein
MQTRREQGDLISLLLFFKYGKEATKIFTQQQLDKESAAQVAEVIKQGCTTSSVL